MPGSLPGRSSPLPWYGSRSGITIPLAHYSKLDGAMFHSSKIHLRQARETYFEHFSAALAISLELAATSGACAVHALVPGLFTRTASRRVAALNAMLVHRSSGFEQLGSPDRPGSEPKRQQLETQND